MGSEEVRQLIIYIRKAIRELRYRDAATGLIALKNMTKDEALQKRIIALIGRLSESEKQIQEEFERALASLGPQS